VLEIVTISWQLCEVDAGIDGGFAGDWKCDIHNFKSGNGKWTRRRDLRESA